MYQSENGHAHMTKQLMFHATKHTVELPDHVTFTLESLVRPSEIHSVNRSGLRVANSMSRLVDAVTTPYKRGIGR